MVERKRSSFVQTTAVGMVLLAIVSACTSVSNGFTQYTGYKFSSGITSPSFSDNQGYNSKNKKRHLPAGNRKILALLEAESRGMQVDSTLFTPANAPSAASPVKAEHVKRFYEVPPNPPPPQTAHIQPPIPSSQAPPFVAPDPLVAPMPAPVPIPAHIPPEGPALPLLPPPPAPKASLATATIPAPVMLFEPSPYVKEGPLLPAPSVPLPNLPSQSPTPNLVERTLPPHRITTHVPAPIPTAPMPEAFPPATEKLADPYIPDVPLEPIEPEPVESTPVATVPIAPAEPAMAEAPAPVAPPPQAAPIPEPIEMTEAVYDPLEDSLPAELPPVPSQETPVTMAEANEIPRGEESNLAATSAATNAVALVEKNKANYKLLAESRYRSMRGHRQRHVEHVQRQPSHAKWEFIHSSRNVSRSQRLHRKHARRAR
jgi:hypothetical protein